MSSDPSQIPEVNPGDWIKIKRDISDFGIDAYVFDVFSSGDLSVGYFQNKAKAIKEDVIWAGSFWKFKYDGPNGSYLRGADEAIVKRGPQRQ